MHAGLNLEGAFQAFGGFSIRAEFVENLRCFSGYPKLVLAQFNPIKGLLTLLKEFPSFSEFARLS